MSRYLVDQLASHPRVAVLTNTEARDLVGDRTLEAVIAEDNQTGQRTRIDARSLFVFIGAIPGTGWLAGCLDVDDHGFIRTGMDIYPQPALSSRTGVFAAGDVRAGSIKRVAASVGEGAMAVRMVHERLRAATGYDESTPE
jgi:thioredoxin reductase (NADPH)